MTLKRSRATPLTGATLGTCKAVPASSSEHTATTQSRQDTMAARWLARRLGVPLSTAGAIACANSWGTAG